MKKVPPEVRNDCLEECIAQYVRSPRRREILRDWLFDTDLTVEQLAEKYHYSVSWTKEIIGGEEAEQVIQRAYYMRLFRGAVL